jgi:hypothetical protein
LFRSPFWLALLISVAGLCSCDRSSTREIGGGYRLKRSSDPAQFVLMTPHENGGLIIDEIGWSEPVILARASGSSYWEAIDTAHARHIRISDAERRSDSAYEAVDIGKVDAAWRRLQSRGRLW